MVHSLVCAWSLGLSFAILGSCFSLLLGLINDAKHCKGKIHERMLPWKYNLHHLYEIYILSPRFSICHSTCWSALHYGHGKNGSLGKITILKIVDATSTCFMICGMKMDTAYLILDMFIGLN